MAYNSTSTVGVQQYDARFDAGVRQTYTWPSKFPLELGSWMRTDEPRLRLERSIPATTDEPPYGYGVIIIL
jgi:hypothetical protein